MCRGRRRQGPWELTGFLAAAKTRPNSELLNRFAGYLCTDSRRERAYLGAGPSDSIYGVYSYARFPTAAAWAREDRTVACQGATQPETPTGSTIDFPMAGVMSTSHSALFRECIAPTGDVTCNLPHTAEGTRPSVTLPAGPWPGTAREASMALRACTPIADAYLGGPVAARTSLVLMPTPITETAWNAGHRSGSCLLDNAGGATTIGTVRAGVP